jgi:transposase-like protein
MELDSEICRIPNLQKEKSNSLYHRIDETVIQIGSQYFWLWFCIEPIHSSVLGIYISEERNMIVAEKFIRSLVEKYGRHPVYTDGGTLYDEACNVLIKTLFTFTIREKSNGTGQPVFQRQN